MREKILGLVKRYRLFVGTLVLLGLLYLLDRATAVKALQITGFSFKEMLAVIPPIFILLGFLDIWVPRETMVKYMGPGSGLKGTVLAIFLGSAAAGPLYGAFPVAAVFLRKGASLVNVLIFLGAWSTTKIPMFLFEVASLGARFAVTRLVIDIPAIILIGLLLERLLSPAEKEALSQKEAGF